VKVHLSGFPMVVTQDWEGFPQPVLAMNPVPFNNLLIHLEPVRIGHEAWMATATIENPANEETAPVALPRVHGTPRAAVEEILREACRRIRMDAWRN